MVLRRDQSLVDDSLVTGPSISGLLWLRVVFVTFSGCTWDPAQCVDEFLEFGADLSHTSGFLQTAHPAEVPGGYLRPPLRILGF